MADITKKFEDSTRLIKDSDKVCFELQQTISRLKMEVMKLKETSKVVAASDKYLKQSTADNEIVVCMEINNYLFYTIYTKYFRLSCKPVMHLFFYWLDCFTLSVLSGGSSYAYLYAL